MAREQAPTSLNSAERAAGSYNLRSTSVTELPRQEPEGQEPAANARPRPINNRRVYNRVASFMQHVTWYGCRSQARLAADAGVSEAALSRFLANQSNPSYALVESICRALEKRLKKPIPARELVSMDGSYPTPSVCDFLGCRGCSPREVYETEAFSQVKPGQYRYGTPGPGGGGSGGKERL